MRRTLLALVFAALPMTAMAEDAAPVAAAAATPVAPARQARLVGVILSSAQALLWDDERGEYVLHRVGDDAFGGRLVELDADHVVIERGEAREVMELTAPPQMRVAGKRAPKRMAAMVISAAPERDSSAVATVAPVAATAPVAAPAPALVAAAPSTDIAIAPPAAAPAVAAAAVAPAAPVAPPAPVVAPPLPPAATPSPAATAPVVTPVTPSAPATPAVAAAVTPARKPVTAMLLPRAELDRALGDFAALSQDVQVAQQPEGGFRLAAVRQGSFFERMGLRPNDVVLRVDGRTINGVDDASAAYAWLRVADRFTVELLRNGQPLTLRYVIQQPMTAAR